MQYVSAKLEVLNCWICRILNHMRQCRPCAAPDHAKRTCHAIKSTPLKLKRTCAACAFQGQRAKMTCRPLHLPTAHPHTPPHTHTHPRRYAHAHAHARATQSPALCSSLKDGRLLPQQDKQRKHEGTLQRKIEPSPSTPPSCSGQAIETVTPSPWAR